MKQRRLVAGILFVIVVASALAQPAPASRGALLYDTHCVVCHNTQLHWRDNRAATDWASLKSEVRRWQGQAQLRWSEDDIDEVVRHLNDRIYRFEQPLPRKGFSVSSRRVLAPS
jgi:mono/diheme cytochrome c family protein